MRDTWWKGLLCLLFVAALVLGLCRFASSPRERLDPEAPPEETPEEQAYPEVIPLDLTALEGGGDRRFAFSLGDFVESYNSLYWQDHQEVFLTSPEDWTLLSYPDQNEFGRAMDLYQFSQDPSMYFLPTVTAYCPPGQTTPRRMSLDLDEHSDTQGKHRQFLEMGRYALALFFPALDQAGREGLLEALQEEMQHRYDQGYSEDLVPRRVYHQGGVGVFACFALGDYQRFVFLPVDQADLDKLAGMGAEVVAVPTSAAQ